MRRFTAHAVVVNTKTVSLERIHQFRHSVAKSFRVEGDVLFNLVDSLTVGPRPVSAVETTLSPAWNYDFSNLYAALTRSGKRLADNICDNDWLQDLRHARLKWLQAGQSEPPNRATGKWQVRILDATDYPRPKTETVRVGYVHSAEGMRKGHGLSLLSARVGEGSWTLPLEIGWIPVDSHPITYGAAQMEEFIRREGWKPNHALVVDAQYTVEPFLRPVHELKVPVLGRVAGNRTFFAPPPEYTGIGRPKVRGEKIRLCDDRTLPAGDIKEEWQSGRNTRIEVRRWDNVHMRQWTNQPLSLYRVIEYKADGQARFKRPLWLIFVSGRPGDDPPSPREAQAIYEERFSIEHSIRFLKQELGLTAGRFSSVEAEGRVQVWTEMVATSFWNLWALAGLVDEENRNIPKWWRGNKITPGAVRRMACGLLMEFGWSKPESKPRGKSPGRVQGSISRPRPRPNSHQTSSP